MSLINPSGDTNSPIWIILSEPYANDATDGIILSGGYGYAFKKTWRLSGINITPYITCLRPCLGATYNTDARINMMLGELNQHKPPFIIAMGDEVLNALSDETRQVKRGKDTLSALNKWSGSLLVSKYLNYPHYMLGTYPPDYVTRNWDYHEIQAFIDFGRLREEQLYFRANGVHQPLPQRNIMVAPDYGGLISYLDYCIHQPLVSIDLETIRPKKGTHYHDIKHPGYPMTTAIAPSEREGMSFCFWDYTPEQAVIIFRLYQRLLLETPQVGQNYYNFDVRVHRLLGLNTNLTKCYDTLIRHHILWPGLPHDLAFMTKQYTRMPYYKDEAQGFNWKYKSKIMRYNALDSCVTYEIYKAQEDEFSAKPHLK